MWRDSFTEAAWQRFVKLFSYALDSVTPLFCMQNIWRIRFAPARTHVEPLVKWNTWRICIKLFRSRFVSFPLWRALEILIAAALSRSPIGQSGRGWNIAVTQDRYFFSLLFYFLCYLFFSLLRLLYVPLAFKPRGAGGHVSRDGSDRKFLGSHLLSKGVDGCCDGERNDSLFYFIAVCVWNLKLGVNWIFPAKQRGKRKFVSLGSEIWGKSKALKARDEYFFAPHSFDPSQALDSCKQPLIKGRETDVSSV